MVIPFCVWDGLGLLWELIHEVFNKGIEYSLVVIHNSFFYPRGAMWFLSACGVAALIIVFLYEKECILIIVALFNFCFALIANTYYFCTINIPVIKSFVDEYLFLFVSARNGIFVGLILFGTGVF